MNKLFLLKTLVVSAAVAAAAAASGSVMAESAPSMPQVQAGSLPTFKIGVILPMTGQQQTTGRQSEAAIRLFVAQNGDTVNGRKVEYIIRDDQGKPDETKRIALEMVTVDKVNVLTGFGLTPLAIAVAPISSEYKIPTVITLAASSILTEKSPYIVRTSFTVAQAAVAMADWAPRNGINRVVTIVSDYGPGVDGEKFFNQRMLFNGGEILDSLRVPLMSPEFSTVFKRVAELKPDAVFVFVPSGTGAKVVKEYVTQGINKAGIKLIGTGDLTDDDQLNDMGDGALGIVTALQYSANHPSAFNRKFVTAFMDTNNNLRPSFVSVAAYDGMHVIYEALRITTKDGSEPTGDSLLAAMKGQKFESPRGQMIIDPKTRDVIHNMYVRKVEKQDGKLYNVEFDFIKMMKDPGKTR